MKRGIHILLVSLFLLVPTLMSGRTMHWEEVNDSSERSRITLNAASRHSSGEEGVEVYAREGYIYVVTDHEIPVRVFSILGHLMGEGELRPGVYRMPIRSRGIFIIKAGNAAMRVTL